MKAGRSSVPSKRARLRRTSITAVVAGASLVSTAGKSAAQLAAPPLTTILAPARRSTITFAGEFIRRGSNVPNVDSTDRTWIVRVESVIEAPYFLTSLQGKEITVLASRPADSGERAVLLTNGWVLGRGYAVNEVARFSRSPDPAAPAAWRALMVTARQAIEDDVLERGLTVSAAVVRVQVVSLTPRAIGTDPEESTEHHPQWRETQVRVRELLKGTDIQPGAVIQVLTPGSDNLAWRDVEKLRVGDERILVLHDPLEFPRRLPGIRVGDRFLIVSKLDVLPVADSTRAKRLQLRGR